jgi:DeoR family glycerol-3-phosphate regulon repressor
MVAGGHLRRSDGGLVGDLTADFISQFKVDYAIIGTSALDEDGDLLDFDLAEIRVSRTIIRQARKSFLVTDSSKLDRAAPAKLCSLEEIDAIFIDTPLPETLTTRCAQWGTRVEICPSSP